MTPSRGRATTSSAHIQLMVSGVTGVLTSLQRLMESGLAQKASFCPGAPDHTEVRCNEVHHEHYSFSARPFSMVWAYKAAPQHERSLYWISFIKLQSESEPMPKRHLGSVFILARSTGRYSGGNALLYIFNGVQVLEPQCHDLKVTLTNLPAHEG
eukprot:6029136-Amphidinium_carterae.1